MTIHTYYWEWSIRGCHRSLQCSIPPTDQEYCRDAPKRPLGRPGNVLVKDSSERFRAEGEGDQFPSISLDINPTDTRRENARENEPWLSSTRKSLSRRRDFWRWDDSLSVLTPRESHDDRRASGPRSPRPLSRRRQKRRQWQTKMARLGHRPRCAASHVPRERAWSENQIGWSRGRVNAGAQRVKSRNGSSLGSATNREIIARQTSRLIVKPRLQRLHCARGRTGWFSWGDLSPRRTYDLSL